MKQTDRYLYISSTLAFFLFCINLPTTAQIWPDTSLPENSTVINGNRVVIQGGTSVGKNLFHSFQEFSIPRGSEAFFNNSLDVQNIITRVTGSKLSNIDGILRANGTANLLLINPSGIVFGPNARLNIGGSLIASTANSIRFADGSFFSATNLQTPALLTINVPTGLQFGANSAAIAIENTGHNLNLVNSAYPVFIRGNENGLRVQPGNSIVLVGNGIALEGGILTGEKIKLGSVETGIVNLDPIDWTLDYSGIQNFKDVEISARSLTDASHSIQIQARSISIRDGSVALIENPGIQPPGKIEVNATESLELVGTTTDGAIASGLISNAIGIGNGGDINISTRGLSLREGGIITARSLSPATGGNVKVNASESVEAIGFSLFNPSSLSTLNTTAYSAGNSGNVTVSTQQLTTLNGGIVGTTTYGSGNGGDVVVNANSIELTGIQPMIFAPSTVGAATFNAGNAGSLNIATSRLVLKDGGRVISSTLASGNAGSVTINAAEFVEVSGTVFGSINPSLIDSSANLADPNVRQILGLPPTPSGASGNVTINAGSLRVLNGGLISVRNDGSGNAGLLSVNAGAIYLTNSGGITAATTSGEGGNIRLQTQILQLRNNSAITATAGGTGNGGNISLETDTFVALENSDITANSIANQGGRVNINSAGIFGSQFRQAETTESDITATGGNPQLSGTVEINTPDVNPGAGLIELPENVADPTTEIVAGCAADRGNRFVVTGRGGLPIDPNQTLRGRALWRDVRILANGESRMENLQRVSSLPVNSNHRSPNLNYQSLIREATGWSLNEKGQLQLVANAEKATGQNAWNQPNNCGI
ncbi:MAG TPA: filamentous hemagglutinin N-terminal domain-containing protein [Leptolyngbyaceae cyanobacterium]